MKVLRGFYKGVTLTTPDDESTRPTVDHFKKHILRLAQEAQPKVIWDLFAGSGGVGIELLSQGAEQAVFVEQTKRAVSCLNLNLAECRLKNPEAFERRKTYVITSSVEAFLQNPKQGGIEVIPDLVFLDPPYGQGFIKKLIPLLFQCALCHPKTLFIAEHVVDDPLQNLEVSGILVTQEIYGPKALSCFRKKS